MMQTRVVSDDGLTLTETGFEVDVRLPWYRALPLSVVQIVGLEIDGQAVDLKDVTFRLEGEEMALSDLRPRTTRWWYVLDSGFLVVKGQTLTAGQSYDVAATIAVRPPYINGLNRIVRTAKTLVAK